MRIYLFRDQPRLFRNNFVVEARRAQLQEPHIKSLTAFVEELRSEVGSAIIAYFLALSPEVGVTSISIPYFDPWDGGIDAECLFLFEAPGGSAVKSDFISRNNNDRTAENFFNFNVEAGLLRKRTISWNIVPWYIGSQARIRPATKKDIEVAVQHLIRLCNLLPKLRAVVFHGLKAQQAEGYLSRSRPDLKIFKLPHPSPFFVNNKPGNSGIIVKWLTDVRRWLDEGV
jgi:uracil-DNA glycosylase